MPAYFDEADLLGVIDAATLIALADDDADGTADATVLADCYSKVTAEIDAALLAGGYEAPVAAPGEYLAGLGARLAIGPLYARRPLVVTPEHTTKLYEEAKRDLRAIAEGKLSVPEATLPSSTTVAGGIAVSSADSRGWADSELF